MRGRRAGQGEAQARPAIVHRDARPPKKDRPHLRGRLGHVADVTPWQLALRAAEAALHKETR